MAQLAGWVPISVASQCLCVLGPSPGPYISLSGSTLKRWDKWTHVSSSQAISGPPLCMPYLMPGWVPTSVASLRLCMLGPSPGPYVSLCQTGGDPAGQNLLTFTNEFFRSPCWWTIPCTARPERHKVANRMGSTVLRTVLVFLGLPPGPTMCGSSDDGSEVSATSSVW